ncbi:MAG: hypothetical protein JOZ55_00020 [Alphaproteobacteria bacterium]|nr:hypothetical protein [Alphaproteobacteria bacterium]
MRFSQKALMAVAGLAVAFTATAASADTHWERHHPRRDEVIDRLQNQDRRIHEERREGQISGREARYLHREDRAIYRQEQFAARLNGGHITRAEKRALNQEENRVSRQIGE